MPTRRTCRYAVSLAAALLLAPAVPARAAHWSDPVAIGRAPRVGQARLGFDSRGHGLAAWSAGSGTVLSTRSAGGRWAGAGQIRDLGVEELAVGNRGRALVAGGMEAGRSVYDDVPAVSGGTVFGGFDGRVPLTRGMRGRYTGNGFTLAANRRGDAVVAWTRYPYPSDDCERCDEVFARVRRAGGPFGPTFTVARKQDLVEVRAAMNAHGDAVVAWSNVAFSGGPVRARLLSPTGRWGGIEDLPGSDEDDPDLRGDPSALAVAMSPRGRVLLAWSTYGVGVGDEGEYGLPVFTSTRTLGSGFTPARQLSPVAAINGFSDSPIDAAPLAGERFLVAWSDGRAKRAQVRAAVLRNARVVGERRVSDPARDALEAGVATSGGRGVVMWATRSAGEDLGQWDPTQLAASVFTGDRFGAPKAVSDPRNRASVDSPRLAVDRAHGRVAAIWVDYGVRDDSPNSVRISSRAVR